jgi:hypothetical protein
MKSINGKIVNTYTCNLIGGIEMAGNGMQDVSAINVRQNSSFTLDAVIDGFLTEKDCEKLYARYVEAERKYGWPEIYRLQANELMLTCEQIIEIPEAEFTKVYGKAMTKRVKAAAQANTQLR